MVEIAVIGAGVMGSAMAVPAAARGHRVALVGTPLDDAIIQSVAGNGHHPRLGLTLPESVAAHRSDDLDGVLGSGPDLVILGVSSAGIGWAIDRLAESLRAPVPVLMITKGLMPAGDTIEVLPALVRREIAARRGFGLPVMAVGGPCIAGELAAGRDTSVVITGDDPVQLRHTIAELGGGFYHARASGDLIGVEVCAAFKNFFALAVGSAAGRLELEGRGRNGALAHNLAAGLFAQAIAEMQVLVEVLGGQRDTVAGLAGAGDLYVTCLAGRNSRMGRLLGLRIPYSVAKAEHMPDETVEGAELALALGPTLARMMELGRLPPARVPLMRAILEAVCRDRPLEVRCETFA